MLHIINAESFRPIFNPNAPHRPTAKKLIAITSTTTSTTTARPITTISATLKSRVLPPKQQATPSPSLKTAASQRQAVRAPLKPLATPSAQSPPQTASNRNANETKDAPVAEALRGHWRRWRRPYYYPASNLLPNPRYRRRPNPKPYYAPPSGGFGFGYGAPYEDYRFETDFLDANSYVPKAKPMSDLGGFYDSQSATYNVPPLKNYDGQSSYYGGSGTATGSAGLGSAFGTGVGGTGLGGTSLGSINSGSSAVLGAGYSTGVGGKGTAAGGTGSGGALANLYSDYGDTDLDYKFSTSKPKTNFKNLPSRAPVKRPKTQTKYNYNSNDEEYRYSGGDTSQYSGASSLESDDASDAKTLAKFNNIYLPPRNNYLPPSKKPKQRPTKPKTTTTTTTTFTPPINIGGNSIDVLTKPLGSATFNLNLSPGTIFNPQPPQINYNQQQPNNNFNQQSNNNFKSIQPIPLQPPSTSYGVPIAPPLNAFTYQNQYQNSYQNQYNPQSPSYPQSPAQNSNGYVDPSSISITNDLARTPGPFAEPPPLNQQTLSNVEVSYNSVQSSYDATPKSARPPKRKPTKVNSKRVSTKRPALNLDEELADDEDTESPDYYGESYSFYKTMPQPSLPNAYDQDDFHQVKNKRKQSKQAANGYEREERSRTTKKPRQPIEVTLRIPDEDYLDDLVKVVQTTKRPRKKTSKTTVSHNLDTEDLRNAYENNSPFYAKKKPKSPRYTTQQPNEYDDNYDDDNGDDDYDTDRLSNVNSKEDTKSSPSADDADAEGSQNSPYWDKESSIYKQYGIRARNDNFPSGSGYEVHSYNNGFRPIRNDYSKTYVAVNHPSDVRVPYRTRDIAPLLGSHNFMANGNRIASTLHTITTTTPKTTTLFVWNGGELPKNHKMA